MTANPSFVPFAPTRTLATAACLVLLTALSGCEKKDNGQTVGQQLDGAVAKTEHAASAAKAKAEDSLGKAGESMKDATQKAEISGKKAADSVAATIDDMVITASVSVEFAKDADLRALKIDVDTKNGSVTITGQAVTAAARDKASTIAKNIKGVTSVNNQLVVKTG